MSQQRQGNKNKNRIWYSKRWRADASVAATELADRAASAVCMLAMADAVLLPPIAPFARGHVELELAVAAPPPLGVDVGLAD